MSVDWFCSLVFVLSVFVRLETRYWLEIGNRQLAIGNPVSHQTHRASILSVSFVLRGAPA